jgi:hypothetical protein
MASLVFFPAAAPLRGVFIELQAMESAIAGIFKIIKY